MFSLPIEVQLDIFKYLNYEELYSVKQTNLYLSDFIINFEGELAREKFYKISIKDIIRLEDFPHKLIRLETENFGFPLNEHIEDNFKNELEKPIPLYLPYQESNNDIIICLTKGLILLFLYTYILINLNIYLRITYL
uniref:F-box domain-containing protein n=1 Tax=Meloidogyne enterolobii TaxID=390850 RepID=A0A6V7TQK5_MELEN|nr:unnamed protein product [Meloidogyne enterolobii]